MRELNKSEYIQVCGGGDTVTFVDNDRDGKLSQGDEILYYTRNEVNYNPTEFAALNQPDSSWCSTADAMQISGAAAAVFGGVVAGVGLLTGPGEVGFGPIGGAIALAGGATSGAGYLIGEAAGCE